MEREELQSLIETPNELVKRIQAEVPTSNYTTLRKQYDPKLHAITDTGKRPDKLIYDTDGKLKSTVPVARLPISMQKKIVHLAAAFLCGKPIKIHAAAKEGAEKDLLTVIKKVWDDNKLDYLSQTIARLLFSETEVAELWYTERVDADYWKGSPMEAAFRLRMKIIANSLGDTLYPLFNQFGDMIAFGRGYSVKVNGSNQDHFDLYTETTIYKGVKSNNEIVFVNEANVIGKIPVIYYSQPLAEWSDVQELIERLETSVSNHGDTNDYFGSPMVKVSGEIKEFSTKGESGKILELENGADASYMSWDQSPKSVELEHKNLITFIHELTDTPNISFESMKGLGVFSGIALKMLFLSPHLKAASKEENFGMGIQRRLNYIKAAIAKLNIKSFEKVTLSLKPVFEYYLPTNDLEMVEMLNTATGAKATISQETAVNLNTLIEDKEGEITKLKEQEKSEGALNDQLNQ